MNRGSVAKRGRSRRQLLASANYGALAAACFEEHLLDAVVPASTREAWIQAGRDAYEEQPTTPMLEARPKRLAPP